MNTTTQPTTFTLQPRRPSDLATAAAPGLSWLWHGYLASGKVTALISPPKSGKTTLLSHLLRRCAEGGTLGALEVKAGRAVVVSEEAEGDWDARCRQLGIGGNVQFVCRPFQAARPTQEQWFAMIAGLEALHRQEALDLVVLDPLARLLPGYAESSGPQMLDCLLPLQALAHLGPAVWLLHHPAKDRRSDGQAARGSSALSGLADILMEMNCYRRPRSRDRRRRIHAYSRYVETPRHLIIELSADGSDYLVRTDEAGVPLVKMKPDLYAILFNQTNKLSQQQILDRWPEEKRPDRSTLSRWLKRAAEQDLVRCSGAGYSHDPFLYWLPEREPFLWPGDKAPEEVKQAWRRHRAANDPTYRPIPGQRIG